MSHFEATRDAYGRALVELGERYENMVVLDADLSGSTRTAKFAEKYPDRFFNLGIAEQNLMNTAAGLALSGKIPFVSTFAIFATGRAWEQVRNTIAYPALPVKIVASHAGLTVGEDGSSHQALEDIALMRVIPNMSVVVPKDGPETVNVLRAIIETPGPVYVRLGRAKVPSLSQPDDQFELGRGEALAEGDDIAFIACGIMVGKALEARKVLQREGISARVINMASIKPLDEDLVIRAAEECGAIVTAEEHTILGGLGGAVSECVTAMHPVPVQRVGVNDRFGQSGGADELLLHYGLSVEGLVEAAGRALDLKGLNT